jgi:four helix bundle protein
MRVTRVEDFEVYRRALAYLKAISDLTESFTKDYWLADALRETAESMLANIAEGYRQGSDRAFARYLTISSGSAEESRTHLTAARVLGHLSQERSSALRQEVLEIAQMLEGLVAYSHRPNRKNRFPPGNSS